MYKLFNGKSTKSFKKYYQEWMDAAHSIEKLFKMKLMAFDPDFQFIKDQQCITLPKWFVLSINSLNKEE